MGKKVKNDAKHFYFFIKFFFLGGRGGGSTNEKNVRHFEKQNTSWYAQRDPTHCSSHSANYTKNFLSGCYARIISTIEAR